MTVGKSIINTVRLTIKSNNHMVNKQTHKIKKAGPEKYPICSVKRTKNNIKVLA